jgi:hypothetical protein
MNGIDQGNLAFTSPFTVTGISNGFEGKIIELWGMNGNATIQHTTGAILLSGAQNTTIPTNGWLRLKYTGPQEVETLTITQAPTTDGNVTVTLDGKAYVIPISATTENTTALVAAKIAGWSYWPAWTTSANGSTVKFVATTSGDRVDGTFDPGTTGVLPAAGPLIVVTQGSSDWFEIGRSYAQPRPALTTTLINSNQGNLNPTGFDVMYLQMTSGFTVNTFSDGTFEGQEVLLIGLNPNATITNLNDRIRLKDDNVATIPTDGTMRLKYVNPAGGALSNGYWIEISRNFTRDRWGVFTANGNGSTTVFNIPHLMPTGVTPASWSVIASSADAGAAGVRFVTATSTNLVVTFTTAPVTGTNNVELRWRAMGNN